MATIDRQDFLQEQLELLKAKRFDPSIEWQDIADFRSAHYGEPEHRDTVRKGSKLIQEYIDAGWMIAPYVEDTLSSPSEKVALQKERIKLQTEKIEYNKWMRESARDEMIAESVERAIKELRPLDVPAQKFHFEAGKGYALCFGDIHYGKYLKISGLYGETLNEYSPEICEKRLWDLYNKVADIVTCEKIKTLHVWDFGDEIDGLLRVSQLMSLRYGVIDSTIMLAELLANWLNVLSKIVFVDFQMVMDSNHCQLRELGQPKGTFKNDNMSKIILKFLQERLKENPNIKITCNPTGYIFDTICGYKILGCHGEVKDMEKALQDFSMIYGVKIDYLIGAHIHHGKTEEIGFDVEVLSIPSLIGLDDYSLSLRKCANAGAKLYCFEENGGKAIEYTIKLQ